MTDMEIIKPLECCTIEDMNCVNCPNLLKGGADNA